MKNAVLGILAIILGLIVLAFPLAGLVAASVLTGFVLLMIAVWLLIVGGAQLEVSKSGDNEPYPGDNSSHYRYRPHFQSSFILLPDWILTVSGRYIHDNSWNHSLASRSEFKNATWAGVLGIILGILYIILGTLALDPIYLGVLIGIWLVISGILALLE